MKFLEKQLTTFEVAQYFHEKFHFRHLAGLQIPALLNSSKTMSYVQDKTIETKKFKNCIKNTAFKLCYIHQRRGAWKTQSKIRDGDFCKNRLWPLAIKYFWKKLHLRPLNGFEICLCNAETIMLEKNPWPIPSQFQS